MNRWPGWRQRRSGCFGDKTSLAPIRNREQEFAIAQSLYLLSFYCSLQHSDYQQFWYTPQIITFHGKQFSSVHVVTDRRTIHDKKKTVAFLHIFFHEFPKYQPPEPRAGHTAAKFATYSNFLIMNIDFAAAATTNSQRLFATFTVHSHSHI